MIVYELNVVALTIGPPQYNPPLIVDTNAVKARPVAAKRFEPVPWRGTKIPELLRRID